ncbi:helix-turn-helix domain-containing protein [Aquipseudomonas ullengensis]|uniref:Helix-turn-helix domain-containing protein n=1 Tax=Aquipseudomonas ullengensis TaxID=2759166 RepID=A0A7W4LI01_9GAMM|nr:helix-turn-helix domain-containing protein [Pseudomonas ullengensis]MBB2493539.1 helix-turn-helix domain-containing protein [Pseudomonas ullengensis]
MHKTPASAVPVFKLYGETASWPTPDLIHCESIPERSRQHDWEIKPHRHGDLVQLLYVQGGTAELEVEGVVHPVRQASLQVVPALSVHGFRFSQDIQGLVLSLALPLVEQLGAVLDSPPLARAACYPVAGQKRYLDALFDSIAQEYSEQQPGRELMLQSLISALLVWVGRRSLALAHAEAQTPDRGREHLQRFTRLLEARFREHRPIEFYAAELGISAAHLNALCRRLAGQSALQLINQRLLLEAKRCLVYTAMTVNQVSDSLGFSEPAYFSRFFKRCSGQSPKAFRSQR